MKRKRIVTIGGGTGQSAPLRGLALIGGRKRFDITGIVGMTDSGGSSGRLRSERGFLPPGDVLKALLALSRVEYAWDMLTKRFGGRVPCLSNHSAGNMLLISLCEHLGNDFLGAIMGMEEILACEGRVLPASLENVSLIAETNEREIRGEGQIEDWFYDGNFRDRELLLRVYLDPKATLLPEAVSAIQAADLVVIGPGSFYTSLVAVLQVQGMAEALRGKSVAYVVNLTTHPKETPHWPASRFVANLEEVICRRVDQVIVNKTLPAALERKYGRAHAMLVEVDVPLVWNGRRVIAANLVRKDAQFARHDPVRLAQVLIKFMG